MRILLSTIGSRGDVQPLLALALELRALGHDARFCVPPDFAPWLGGLGFHVTPIGPELRPLTAARSVTPVSPPTPEQRRRGAAATVAAQFATVAPAARGCDHIVGATALQVAARSIAEALGIGYTFVAYCPVVLPSRHHAPPPLPLPGLPPAAPDADIAALWAANATSVAEVFGEPLNVHRATLGLPPVTDVRGHIFTGAPWLAADATLAPWPGGADTTVVQDGAWIVPDDRPLPPEVSHFLDAGSPPVYFGLGSMRVPGGMLEAMLGAARAVGRRALFSRGWGDLAPVDGARDCLVIDDVNQQALFPHVAVVVHHGGAGTTTAAAMCGAPQVIIPQGYDQHYWAQRVQHLGIGVAHAPWTATADSLTRALGRALGPGVTGAARRVGSRVRRDGARAAAERLTGGRS